MSTASIYIVPDDAFDDWIVQDEDGREIGHFPTREAAEMATNAIARERGAKIVVRLPDGRVFVT